LRGDEALSLACDGLGDVTVPLCQLAAMALGVELGPELLEGVGWRCGFVGVDVGRRWRVQAQPGTEEIPDRDAPGVIVGLVGTWEGPGVQLSADGASVDVGGLGGFGDGQ
jgi:hypothetical protein